MALSFVIYCGRCFAQIPVGDKGGMVLSCSDFICSNCSNSLASSRSCPACGKENVRAVFLNHSLPEEVKQNITDTSKDFEHIVGILEFQTKYYKSTIKKLVAKIQQYDMENQKQKSYTKELEIKLQQRKDTQPFFTNHGNKDSDQRSEIFYDQPEFTTFPKRSTAVSADHRSSSYFKSNSVEIPQTHRRPSIPSSPVPSVDEGRRSPFRGVPVDRRMSSLQPIPQVVSDNDADDKFRKRIFTPSRTIFSSQNYRHENENLATPSRIRSPHIGMVKSPSAALLPPPSATTGRLVNAYRGGRQQEFGSNRAAQSPITSFIRQSFN